MNWHYLGIAALLPLTIGVSVTMLVGALMAVRLHRGGGSSRVAFRRFLITIGLTFPTVFLLSALWEGRATLQGLIGVALGRVEDQRSIGILRAYGEGFLAKNPFKARQWYQKAAEGGDREAQLLLAKNLLEDNGLMKDPVNALRWSVAAAQQNDPYAMLLAGELLAGTNSAASATWYRKALPLFQQRALQGDAEAALACGSIHMTGKGTPKNVVEGLAWMLAAEHMGLHPIRTLMVKITESNATPAQQTEAKLRMQELQRAGIKP